MHARGNVNNIDINILYSIILQCKKNNYIRYCDYDGDDVAKIGLLSLSVHLHDVVCSVRSIQDNYSATANYSVAGALARC